MNDVLELINAVRQTGATLRADPPDLVIAPSGKVSPELKQRLRQRKSEVIAYLSAQPDVSEIRKRLEAADWTLIEERAAIMEIEGGLNREEANCKAFMWWFDTFIGSTL